MRLPSFRVHDHSLTFSLFSADSVPLTVTVSCKSLPTIPLSFPLVLVRGYGSRHTTPTIPVQLCTRHRPLRRYRAVFISAHSAPSLRNPRHIVFESRSKPLPPLVFIHGSFHAAWCWGEHWMPFLASKGYETFAISLRGTSGTPPPELGVCVVLPTCCPAIYSRCLAPFRMGRTPAMFNVQTFEQPWLRKSSNEALAPRPSVVSFRVCLCICRTKNLVRGRSRCPSTWQMSGASRRLCCPGVDQYISRIGVRLLWWSKY